LPSEQALELNTKVSCV